MRCMEDSIFAISYSRLIFAGELPYAKSVSQRALTVDMVQSEDEGKIYYFSLWKSFGHPQAISLQLLQGISNPPKELS